MLLWAKLADSSRRFLIYALEAEIWVPLVGGTDEVFRSESRGKNVVRDGNMDKNNEFDR